MRYAIVSRCLGLLLLAAAGLKLYGFGVDPVAPLGVFSAPAFRFLVILFEVALGAWLLSARQQVGAWLVVLTTFGVFAVVSCYQGWLGQASCGCLGSKVSVNPWIMFAIDLAAVLALVIARPDLQPLKEHRARIARTALGVVGTYLILVGALGAVVHFGYGSIDSAMAHLRQERISAHPSLVDVGEGAPGEMREGAVELTNRTDHPIRVIGGTSDCSCTVLGDLPIAIPPGETRSIRITVRLPNSRGSFNRRAALQIDDGGSAASAFA